MPKSSDILPVTSEGKDLTQHNEFHIMTVMEFEKKCEVSGRNRKCTDCACLVLFFLLLTAWIVLGSISVFHGKPHRLVYGDDYRGLTCGMVNEIEDGEIVDYTNRTQVVYPRLTKDLAKWALSQNLGSISTLDPFEVGHSILSKLNLTGICLNSCPKQGDIVCLDTYLEVNKNKKPKETDLFKCRTDPIFSLLNTMLCNSCWQTPIDTTSIMYRCLEIIYTDVEETEVCILPEVDPPLKANDPACEAKTVTVTEKSNTSIAPNPVGQFLGDGFSLFHVFVDDARETVGVFFVTGTMGAIFISYLYMLLLRYCAHCLVWSTLITFLVLLFSVTFYCWYKAGFFDEDLIESFGGKVEKFTGLKDLVNTTNKTRLAEYPSKTFMLDSKNVVKTYKVLAIVFSILTFLAVLLVMYLKKAVNIATDMIKSASHALSHFNLIFLMPLISIAIQCVLFVVFIYIGSLILTMEKNTVADAIESVCKQMSPDIEYITFDLNRQKYNNRLCADGSCCDANDQVFTKEECEEKIKTPTKLFANGTIEKHYVMHKWSEHKNALSWEEWLKRGGCEATYGCTFTNAQCQGTPVVCTSNVMNQGTNAKNKMFVEKSRCEMQLGCSYTNNKCTGTLQVPVQPCAAANDVYEKITTQESVANSCLNLGNSFREYSSINKVLFFFHVFMFLWVLKFIVALDFLILAGAVSQWYWTRPLRLGSTRKTVGFCILCESSYRVYRYHLGSIALGSFVIAIFQTIRIIMIYIDSKTRELQKQNKCVKIFMKVIHCCLWCFEKFIKFIAKNAYIMVAMRGGNFCTSAKHAFCLIANNVKKFSVTKFASNTFITIGNIVVTIGCCILCYMWLNDTTESVFTKVAQDHLNIAPPKDYNSQMVPIVLTGLLSYVISNLLLGVYENTIDVILLCFCEDYTLHIKKSKNQAHMAYMDQELRHRMLGNFTLPIAKDEVEEFILRELTIEEAASVHLKNVKEVKKSTKQYRINHKKKVAGIKKKKSHRNLKRSSSMPQLNVSRLFEQADSDKSGKMDHEEFVSIIASLGKYSKDRIEQVLEDADDGDGSLTLGEFDRAIKEIRADAIKVALDS
eukprot:g5714.t1